MRMAPLGDQQSAAFAGRPKKRGEWSESGYLSPDRERLGLAACPDHSRRLSVPTCASSSLVRGNCGQVLPAST